MKVSCCLAEDCVTRIQAMADLGECKDDSACLVVKESFGNAFVPFLVDNYQYTYICDHRYFAIYEKYGNDFVKMVKDKNIKDVILLNTTTALCDTSLSSTMAGMFE